MNKEVKKNSLSEVNDNRLLKKHTVKTLKMETNEENLKRADLSNRL